MSVRDTDLCPFLFSSSNSNENITDMKFTTCEQVIREIIMNDYDNKKIYRIHDTKPTSIFGNLCFRDDIIEILKTAKRDVVLQIKKIDKTYYVLETADGVQLIEVK